MTATQRSLISRRVLSMNESVTMAMTQRAIELRAQGVDVISLSAGEPDFDTPEHIRQAAVEAMNDGKTKYTIVAGITELRETLSRKYESEMGLAYDKDQILVSAGAKQAIYNIIHALIDPGDEVIIPAPYWVSYPDMVKSAAGKPIILPTSEDDGFLPRPEDIEKAINSKTKILLYSSPSNPTGAVIPESHIRLIARVLEETEITVISDEVYEKLLYGDAKHYSIAQLAPEFRDRTVIVSSVSKTYSMTGWRIGWAIGPTDIIKAAGKIQGQSTSCANSIGQYAALAALKGDQSFVATMRDEYLKRRELVVSRLRSIPGIKCRTPDGAFFAFPNVSALYGKAHGGRPVSDSVSLAELLLDEAKIAVVPGSGFGAPDNIRISYAASPEQLTAALNRMERFVRELL